MNLEEIYNYAKTDRHIKNPHTMRFNYLNYYPLESYSFRSLRFTSPLLTLDPVYQSQIHPFTKVLKVDDDLHSLITSLQIQSSHQITKYNKRTNETMIYYTLPSNQLFMYNPNSNTFVDNAIVELAYKTRTGDSKHSLVVDFGKNVIVNHMCITGEKIIQSVLPQWGSLAWVGDGKSKKYIPNTYLTRKEKKELSKPQICVKPTKQEQKLVSPIKQFKLSYKNKQGKWVMLKIHTAPDRFEVMIDLSQYTCLNTRYLKIELLNYISSPTLKINYLFYGVEQTTKTNAVEQVTEDVYKVQMARSYKRVVDGSYSFINLHKRVRKYKRGEKWTGRSAGEYNDVHTWLRMSSYYGDKQCKRYNTIHKQMKEDYREWEADMWEADMWEADMWEADMWVEYEYKWEIAEEDDYKCSWEADMWEEDEYKCEIAKKDDYKWSCEHASEADAW
jgi:hypothetical protein